MRLSDPKIINFNVKRQHAGVSANSETGRRALGSPPCSSPRRVLTYKEGPERYIHPGIPPSMPPGWDIPGIPPSMPPWVCITGYTSLYASQGVYNRVHLPLCLPGCVQQWVYLFLCLTGFVYSGYTSLYASQGGYRVCKPLIMPPRVGTGCVNLSICLPGVYKGVTSLYASLCVYQEVYLSLYASLCVYLRVWYARYASLCAGRRSEG